MLVPKSKRKSSKAGKEQTLRGTELRSRLASVSRTVEHLENTLQSLPRVDSRGGSDCPFTRELYARKEKLQASVSSSVAELRKYKVAIEKEITRCRKNLEHIGSAHGRVHTPDAVDALGDAEQAQRDELQSAISGRDAITLVLPRAEAALQVST